MLERVRCRRNRQDRSGAEGCERAGGADRLAGFVRLAPGADRAGGGGLVPMALWRAAGGRACGRTLGNAAREGSALGDACEDGPQRRAGDCTADAAWLVPSSALQIG